MTLFAGIECEAIRIGFSNHIAIESRRRVGPVLGSERWSPTNSMA